MSSVASLCIPPYCAVGFLATALAPLSMPLVTTNGGRVVIFGDYPEFSGQPHRSFIPFTIREEEGTQHPGRALETQVGLLRKEVTRSSHPGDVSSLTLSQLEEDETPKGGLKEPVRHCLMMTGLSISVANKHSEERLRQARNRQIRRLRGLHIAHKASSSLKKAPSVRCQDKNKAITEHRHESRVPSNVNLRGVRDSHSCEYCLSYPESRVE